MTGECPNGVHLLQALPGIGSGRQVSTQTLSTVVSRILRRRYQTDPQLLFEVPNLRYLLAAFRKAVSAWEPSLSRQEKWRRDKQRSASQLG